jgi:hypothetical protein
LIKFNVALPYLTRLTGAGYPTRVTNSGRNGNNPVTYVQLRTCFENMSGGLADGVIACWLKGSLEYTSLAPIPSSRNVSDSNSPAVI